MKPAIHLAFSDNGEHIRFWTASEGHAREWARENWETERFFSDAQMADAQAEISRLRELLERAATEADNACVGWNDALMHEGARKAGDAVRRLLVPNLNSPTHDVE